MKRPSSLPPPLTNDDIPPHIREGCTDPYAVGVRGLALFFAYFVLYFISTGFQRYVLSSLGLKGKIIDVATKVVTAFAMYKLFGRVWTFISNEMRNCHRYNRFIAYYKEMTRKGMESKFAIEEALELIERDQREKQLRRGNISNRNIRIGL